MTGGVPRNQTGESPESNRALPASAVCGQLGLPSLETEAARLGPGRRSDRNDRPPACPKKKINN